MTKKAEDQEVVLDDAALKTITDAVVAGLGETVAETVKSEVAEATKGLEKVVKKNVAAKKDADGNDVNEDDEPQTEEEKAKAALRALTPQARLMKSAIALTKGDRTTLKALNEVAVENIEKAGYANSDTNADGGYIVADPEFEAEVEKLANDYGVAFNEADVRNINSSSIKTNKRGSNVTMYETGQGAKKKGTKLTIDSILVELRKFAAIAIATDELVEDAAIDFWAEVTQGFAEERARIADELVFTDDGGSLYNQSGVGTGILETAGVAVETVGNNINLITWDDLLNAEAKVPTASARNGKHYMHRTVYNLLRQSKGSDGHYIAPLNSGLQTPWGTPVVLVDVLPASNAGQANAGYTVFGDLKRVKLYVKRGLVLTEGKEATVTDADDEEVNLYEQDMSALRAVTRMVALVKFPEAFCVVGTGTVS
jgi:HK97 family phage major capsid protein